MICSLIHFCVQQIIYYLPIMKRVLLSLCLLTLLVTLLSPQKISCGQPLASCSYPTWPDSYATRYEVQPRAVTRRELQSHTNSRLYYRQGIDHYSDTQVDDTYESNVWASCSGQFECQTPMDYLIQSNCPFDSACIAGTCQVICPLLANCEQDADCNCSERGVKTLDCVCYHNSCVSVEAR